MVPVRLALSNFLSYGTDVQELDFSSIKVACLSGANGQGKSALIDAMTWALWGEARKAGSRAKPDEDLVRIGAARMEVEFDFDLEGNRYRVKRAYARATAGKGGKSSLELYSLEEDGATWHLLTSPSIRETQARLNVLLGIDYDTFISSAFLIQGRSDEFTRRTPGDRKEILGKILNLDRFERLSQRARDKQRLAEDSIRLLEADVARLTAELETEASLQEQAATTRKELEETRVALNELRNRYTSLTVGLSELDRIRTDRDTHHRQLGEIRKREERLSDELRQTDATLQGAREVVAQADEIEAENKEYEALLAERDSLEHARELFLVVEARIRSLRENLAGERRQLENRIELLEQERKRLLDLIEADQELVSGRDKLNQRLQEARVAASALHNLNAQEAEFRQLQTRKVELEQYLRAQKTERERRMQELTRELSEEATLTESIATLAAEEEKLLKACELQETRKRELQEVQEAGARFREQIQNLKGLLEANRKELERLLADRERIIELREPRCPTCGTELNDSNRTHAEGHYRERIEALQAEIGPAEQNLVAAERSRERLLERFQNLKTQIDSDCSEGDLQQVRTRIAEGRARQEQLTRLSEALEALKVELAERSFCLEEQEEWRRVVADLKTITYDEQLHRETMARAAGLESLEEQFRRLAEAEGRVEGRRHQLARKEAEVKQLREDLQSEAPFRKLLEALSAEEERLSSIGFDGERYEQVRARARLLENAPNRLFHLVNARTEIERCCSRREELLEESARLAEQAEGVIQVIKDNEAKLQSEALLRSQMNEAGSSISFKERSLNLLQRQVGDLDARLERCSKAREELGLKKAEARTQRGESGIYKTLCRAFSKNGIPTLIIEQTLPSLEDYANDLLERLTDGRMHIRLQTQVEKRDGSTRETLEIIITDDTGQARPYETYSGGEAFRVNFALRVALARVLAERSGVRIRTLVLDEGFGTQDDQGVQALVEAIAAIRPDFDKILIITHIDALREAFPVRIEVSKDPVRGSSFTVFSN